MEHKAILKGYILAGIDTGLTIYVEQITRNNKGLLVNVCPQPEDAMRFQNEHEALVWSQIVNLSHEEQGYPNTRFKAMKLLTVLEDIKEGKENDQLDH